MDKAARKAAKKALRKRNCPACNTGLTPTQVFHPGHCGQRNCAEYVMVQAHKKREKEREKAYAKRIKSAKKAMKPELKQAARYLEEDRKAVRVGVVPYQNAPLAPISDSYQAALGAHLDKIIEATFAAADDARPIEMRAPDEGTRPFVFAAACGACQGKCCARGGGETYAFLGRETIQHVRAQSPDLSPEEIRQTYLDAVPERSVQGACAFQSERGCTLARDWRASICNTFICHDLDALWDAADRDPTAPIVIFGLDDDEVARKAVAFDGEAGARAFEKGA